MEQKAGGNCCRRARDFPACTSVLGTASGSCSDSSGGDTVRSQSRNNVCLLGPVLGAVSADAWGLLAHPKMVVVSCPWSSPLCLTRAVGAARALGSRTGCCDRPLSSLLLCVSTSRSSLPWILCSENCCCNCEPYPGGCVFKLWFCTTLRSTGKAFASLYMYKSCLIQNISYLQFELFEARPLRDGGGSESNEDIQIEG